MQGFTFEAYQDKEKIRIEDGMLKFRKTSGTYKDYGNNFYKVWLEAFNQLPFDHSLVVWGNSAPSPGRSYPLLWSRPLALKGL